MNTHLGKYLENISNLPHEVKHNFSQMQELDQQTHNLMDKLEQATRGYLKKKRGAKDTSVTDDRALQKIRDDFKRAIEMSDEKIELAVQTYELVDKHIRRLDSDLKRFEAELEQQETKGKGKSITKASKHKENGKGQKKSVRGSGGAGNDPHGDVAPRLFNVDIDMPIDPNEPTYCICNRVSFGEMVGCDNPDCRIEWFHFECVGLTSPPKGKWYCNECAALRKKQGIIKK